MNYDYRPLKYPRTWSEMSAAKGYSAPRIHNFSKLKRAPYAMSPSRAIPFPPDRARVVQAQRVTAMPSARVAHRVEVATTKCDRRKTQTSFSKCVGLEARKLAQEIWKKCHAKGTQVLKGEGKGLSRNGKKSLKRDTIKQCLRNGG